jgi:hypothetical protein
MLFGVVLVGLIIISSLAGVKVRTKHYFVACHVSFLMFKFLIRWKRIRMGSRHWCSPRSVNRSWKGKC